MHAHIGHLIPGYGQPPSKGHVPREGDAEGPSGKSRNNALRETLFQSLRISPEEDVGYLQLQTMFIIGLGMGQSHGSRLVK